MRTRNDRGLGMRTGNEANINGSSYVPLANLHAVVS